MLDAYTRLGDVEYQSACLSQLADLALHRGQAAEARGFAEQALERARHAASQPYELVAHRVLGDALLAAGDIDQAEQELNVAQQLQHLVGNPYDGAFVTASLARLAHARQNFVEALRLAREALAEARRQHIRRLVNDMEALIQTIEEA